MWTRLLNVTLMGLTFAGLCSFVSPRAGAQSPATQTSALSPPINHESGQVEEIITAADDGFRFRGYVLLWRSTRIVVAGTPDESHRAIGETIDFQVWRTGPGLSQRLSFSL
jgi:hypothetical protein